jgi:hypothetical protein
MKAGRKAPLVTLSAKLTYAVRIGRCGQAMTDKPDMPERPRAEPEIIPPDRTNHAPDWQRRGRQQGGPTWVGGTQRIYVGRIGPVGLALLILMIGILAALILLTVVGAVLLWIPILVLAVAAGAIFRLLRR